MTINSYAKVNIFLKIVGKRENYHEIISRFMIVNNLFDTITLKKKETLSNTFDLIGDFGCKTEQNTIYKAFLKLKEYANSNVIENFFKEHNIIVEKNIPEFAGLGGGSSNAASFLLLANKMLELNLSKDDLAKIGAQIGADVPFFIYEYASANVSGTGEIVEQFKEPLLTFATVTPSIKCDTKKVYQKFRKSFFDTIDISFAKELLNMKSADILKQYKAEALNDLFPPGLALYPNLQNYNKKGWFFSGSGSTFFMKEIDG